MTDNYYALTAYNSTHIPQNMPPQTHQAGPMPLYARLPWGGNKDTTFERNEFVNYPPKFLRKYKGTKFSYSFIGDERYGAITHQFIRPNSIERSSRFWIFLYGAGIVLTPFSIFLMFLMYLTAPFFRLDDIIDRLLLVVLQYITLPLIVCFIIGYIVINYIPFLARRPGMGSRWELNRQTGMVTNYTYNKKDPGNPISADSVPFYECDAYLWSLPDRYGITHSIVLGHRYSDRQFFIGDIIHRVNSPPSAYAYWDFIQNFMDTSKPLPDMPILEQFRALDPVTAEYDKKTGRDPHYFLNMDNKTWRKVKKNIGIERIMVEGRHCLMQQNGVVYFPSQEWGRTSIKFDAEQFEEYKKDNNKS